MQTDLRSHVLGKLPLSSYSSSYVNSYLELTCDCSDGMNIEMSRTFTHTPCTFPPVYNFVMLVSVIYIDPSNKNTWVLYRMVHRLMGTGSSAGVVIDTQH
jgi:hypothetical protein